MLLTLDLATCLGFTKGHVSDRQFQSGYFRLPSTGVDIGRFAAAYDIWLADMLMNVTETVFEQPILPKVTQLVTVRKLTGLCWHTEFLTTQMGIKCYEANLSSVKKAIGGHGRAQKSDMIRAVQSYGYDVTEENEADAVAVRLYTIMTRHKELAADFGLTMGLLGTKGPSQSATYQQACKAVRDAGLDIQDGLALTFSCADYPSWVRDINGWAVEDAAKVINRRSSQLLGPEE